MNRFIIASALVAALATPVSAGTVDTVKDSITDADAYLADVVFGNSTLNYIAGLGWLVDLGVWFDGLGGVPSAAPNISDSRH